MKYVILRILFCDDVEEFEAANCYYPKGSDKT